MAAVAFEMRVGVCGVIWRHECCVRISYTNKQTDIQHYHGRWQLLGNIRMMDGATDQSEFVVL